MIAYTLGELVADKALVKAGFGESRLIRVNLSRFTGVAPGAIRSASKTLR